MTTLQSRQRRADKTWLAAEAELIRHERLTPGDLQTFLKHRHGIELGEPDIKAAVVSWCKARMIKKESQNTDLMVAAYRLYGGSEAAQ